MADTVDILLLGTVSRERRKKWFVVEMLQSRSKISYVSIPYIWDIITIDILLIIKGIAVFQELPLLTGAFDHKTDILRCLLFSSDDNHNRCDEEYRCGD